MQEQSGKQSRDMIKSSYRCMKDIYTMVIELIRQFYSLPRQFRIVGKQGEEQFITYSNQRLVRQQLDTPFGYRFSGGIKRNISPYLRNTN